MAAENRPERGKGRIEALADGVFAIAMTLMVLAFDVPEPADEERFSLVEMILGIWPRFHTYAISFLVLGVYWISHDTQFRYIRHADRTLLWINVFFLMVIALVPFSTEILGKYPREQHVVVLYAINLVMLGILLYMHWWYATGNRRLVDPDLDPRLIRLVSVRTFAGPVACMVAVAVSFFDPMLSTAMFLLVPVFYALPRFIGRLGGSDY